MKRVLILLLCLVLFATPLVACADTEDPCTHTYSETWSKDAEGHWYAATCDCEEAIANERKLAHTDANNDGACDVCAYTNHEHEYAEGWTVDCTNHWHAASCGHTVAGTDVAAHADANNDGKCDVCAYVIEDIHEHYYSTEWSSDAEYHWHAALCEHGVEVADKTAHEVNAAGYCTVCEAKVNEVDETDLAAVLAAALANNHKVVSGNVVYEYHIPDPDINITSTHEQYYVLGNGASYIKRTQYGDASQTWYQLLGEDEVFGVMTYDAGVTLEPVSAGVADMNGYIYMPSTLTDSDTLAGILSNLYELSQSETAWNYEVLNNADENAFVFAYDYLAVNEVTGGDSFGGNDEDTSENQTVVNTSLFYVVATFQYNDDFVITSADFQVGAYNQDIDGDYTYNAETGELTMSENAYADTYTYHVAQTAGERTYQTAYPKASLVPTDFELALPDGTVPEGPINVETGTYVSLNLVELVPFSAMVNFIDPEDFELSIVSKENPEVSLYSYYWNGTIGFSAGDVGEYSINITYGDIVKTYDLVVNPASPTAIGAYKFGWIQGYDTMVYTADMYNPGLTSTMILEVGETFDFAVLVSPYAAEQGYDITVDSTDATLTEVTLTDVVVFYEMFEEYTAWQFKSDVEGVYTVTMTSTVNPDISGTVTVYVGVEPETSDSTSYDLVVPNSDFGSSKATFTAPASGVYAINATLPEGVWLQVYDAESDSWSRIDSSLPYSVECAEGDQVEVRIFTSMSVATEDRGTTVTVTISADGGSEGGETLEGSGTDSDPYVIEGNGNYTCAFPGGYNYVFYTYTATEAGTLTINVTSSDYFWGYGSGPYALENVGSSIPSLDITVGAGETVYIGMSTNSASAGDVTFTSSFVASGSGTDTPTTPDGSADLPFALEAENTCAFPSGYNYVFYTYTATEAGTLTINVTSSDYFWGYGSGPYALENVGSSIPSLDITVGAGETVYIGMSTNSASAGDVTFTSSFVAGGGESGGAVEETPLQLNVSNQIEAANITYAYTATENGSLTLDLGGAVMGMVSVTYSVNGGDAVVFELSTSVTLDLVAGDKVVIVVEAEGYSSIGAVWAAEVSEAGETPLQLASNQIEAANVTYAYTATENGSLTLELGGAVMGMVSVTYSVNGGEAVVFELSTSVTLDLVAGDKVVIVVEAEGYSSITAAWTAA